MSEKTEGRKKAQSDYTNFTTKLSKGKAITKMQAVSRRHWNIVEKLDDEDQKRASRYAIGYDEILTQYKNEVRG